VPPPASPPGPASARERLPAFLGELLREGGPELFDSVERALVHAAFEHAHGNQVRAARALGLTRNMVRTLLKRHGLLGCEPPLDVGRDAVEGGPAALSAV
jgi:sigma-54 dependent transcriptional regulator